MLNSYADLSFISHYKTIFDALRLEQNGSYTADDNFKRIF